MAYIRTKKINNKPYAYLVENISTINGPRQKVKKYLGRIHELNDANNKNKSNISANTKKEFLKQLRSKHLENHQFNKQDQMLTNNIVKFNLNSLTFKKGVLNINNGYLCNFTINRILEFKKTKDLQKDGTILAKHFLNAGLPVSQEEFVMFYQLF